MCVAERGSFEEISSNWEDIQKTGLPSPGYFRNAFLERDSS